MSCSAGSDTPQNFVLWGIRPSWQIKTPQNQTKKFWELAILFKGHFSKIGCMYKLHYPRHIGFMLKESPIWKFFCVPRGLIPRRTTLKLEYFRDFEPEFENVSGYELGAHMRSIHEKNQGPKISCYCTFKGVLQEVAPNDLQTTYLRGNLFFKYTKQLNCEIISGTTFNQFQGRETVPLSAIWLGSSLQKN